MIKSIELTKIYSSGNVRNEIDKTLLELKASIEKNGLLQPIVVRRTDKGFEIIAGHRRFQAVKMIGEPFIECNILEDSVSEFQSMAIHTSFIVLTLILNPN